MSLTACLALPQACEFCSKSCSNRFGAVQLVLSSDCLFESRLERRIKGMRGARRLILRPLLCAPCSVPFASRSRPAIEAL